MVFKNNDYDIFASDYCLARVYMNGRVLVFVQTVSIISKRESLVFCAFRFLSTFAINFHNHKASSSGFQEQ